MILSMRSLAGLTGVLVLALFSHVEAATLNKCIDAKGEVTYSNLPCANAQKTRTVEIDPAPPPEPVQAQPAVSEPQPAVREPAPTHVKTPRASAPSLTRASPSKCEALTDKLGKVIDKMDQAHRKGYTQKQMDAWNLEVKELERKKQQSGCF